MGRAPSSSPGTVEAGWVLGRQEDLHPLPSDTVSTECQPGGGRGRPEPERAACCLQGSHQPCPCFLELFSVTSSYCLHGTQSHPGPRNPRCFPTAAWKGSLSRKREVFLLPWALDQPRLWWGGRSRAPWPSQVAWFLARGPHNHPEKKGLLTIPISQMRKLRPAKVTHCPGPLEYSWCCFLPRLLPSCPEEHRL